LEVGFNKGDNQYRNRVQFSNFSRQVQGSVGGNNHQKGIVNDNPKALVPMQKIYPAQMDERRRKGLCYSCDAKWSRGHVCVMPKLFLIEEVEGLEEGLRVVNPEKEEEDLGLFFFGCRT
jgi:hypothetical protein